MTDPASTDAYPDAIGDEGPAGWPRMRIAAWAAGCLVFAAAGLFMGRSWRAARAGVAGKDALLAAEAEFRTQDMDGARAQLDEARRSFRTVRAELRGLGPLRPIAHALPFVRVQMRASEAFADAGLLVSQAGIELSSAASGITSPDDNDVRLGSALSSLQAVRAPLHSGAATLDLAVRRVAALDGRRLIGPLDGARRQLSRQLPVMAARARDASTGLDALLVLLGGKGPRRYLLFNQNPDEVRPTGGFIGTYGLMTADGKTVGLDRFEPIENWMALHPNVVVPDEREGPPFRVDPRFGQTLANVNAVADWPKVTALAMELWTASGEQPVDGVLSVTPAFVARLLSVTGPVRVDAFGETVTADNVIERFDYYTAQFDADPTVELKRLRKSFVAELSRITLNALLTAPASKWPRLASAVGAAFDRREAMGWTTDGDVNRVLRSRGWDGTLPASAGDFFYNAEFEYMAKNGRGIKRTFDHRVALRPDGSGRVTTTITIANTKPATFLNQTTLSHITLYGPRGGKLAKGSKPEPTPETALAGHPAAAWFSDAPPLEKQQLRVVWDVPHLARRDSDGAWTYGLWWMRLPDHTGDELRLRVDLPKGWRWKERPPTRVALDRDLVDSWSYVKA